MDESKTEKQLLLLTILSINHFHELANKKYSKEILMAAEQ